MGSRPDSYEDCIRIATSREVADAIIKAICDVMIAHGDDPRHVAIVSTGIVLATIDIGEKIDDLIPRAVLEFLRRHCKT